MRTPNSVRPLRCFFEWTPVTYTLASIMYLRTDEEFETANAMEMATQFASSLAKDLHLWRWVIIALHNAAQGVMASRFGTAMGYWR
jgi:hypothetical protein